MLLRTSSAPLLNSFHPSTCCLIHCDSDSPSSNHHGSTTTASSQSGQAPHHHSHPAMAPTSLHRRRQSTDIVSISEDLMKPPPASASGSLLNRAQSEGDLACFSAAMSAVGADGSPENSHSNKQWNRRLSLHLNRSTASSSVFDESILFEELERYEADINTDITDIASKKKNSRDGEVNGFVLSDGELYTSLDVSSSGAPVACNGKGCRPLTESECKKLGFLDLASGLGSSGAGGSGNGFHAFTAIGGPDFNSDITEAHYQSLLEKDPQNPLLLSNYAHFLSEKNQDFKKSEEYYERAILADPTDADVLSQYAKLQWDVHRDQDRAESYFGQATQAAPDDCYVMASYASFLWDVDENDDDTAAPMMPSVHGGTSVATPLFASA